MAIVILSNQTIDTVNAVSTSSTYDELFFSQNKIVYYDPRCATEQAEGVLSFSGKDNLDIIMKFFMQGHGLTVAQAAGLAGNMAAESGLDPTIIQGGAHAQPGYRPQPGVGFGLVQWTSGGRQQNLVDFIYGVKDGKNKGSGAGVDITDINGQLNFAWKELSESYPDTLTALKATDDPVQAAVVVHDGYESSGDSHTQVVTNRGGNATKFYKAYADAPAIAGSTADPSIQALGATSTDTSSQTVTASGGCTSGGFSGGDLGQTVKAYAWPSYIPAGGSTNSMPGYEGKTINATDMTEAYAQAVQKAKAAGQYTGGIRLVGIDCGGAVTRIMIDSGFEKRYNYNGKISDGAGYTGIQEAWLKTNWTPISATNASDRQPGDVAINDSHTYIYVGKGVFASGIVSASLDERAPMQGHEGITDSSFRWYRKKVSLSGAEL